MKSSLNSASRAFLDKEHALLIDGDWVGAAGNAMLDSIDPATEEPIARFAAANQADIDSAVAAARRAFDDGPWAASTPSQRSALLLQLADAIDANAETLTQLEILDTGMPLNPAGMLAAPGAAKMLRYYAGWPGKIAGQTLSADHRPGQGRAPFTYTRREPVGVVAQIIPWNYPLGMTAMKLGPALATGCTVVLKPDEHTPLTALFLGELIQKLDFPPGVVNIVPGTGINAGAPLVAHPDVDKVAFTGSTETGRHIVRAAAGNLKRVTLELGGKNPFIVFRDADLDQAVAAASRLGFFLQGQNCQCPSRMYLHEAIYDKFVARLLAAANAMQLGHGLDPDTRIGPLISAQQRERVEGYIAAGRDEGAELLAGGERPNRPGYFVAPTVFGVNQPDLKIVREEIFGPVLCLQRFSSDNLDDIVSQANDTCYGLVASVWTRDLGIAHEMAERIKAGTVGINHHGGGDITAPFGGYKESGWGREFGAASLDPYLETKTVVVNYA